MQIISHNISGLHVAETETPFIAIRRHERHLVNKGQVFCSSQQSIS